MQTIRFCGRVYGIAPLYPDGSEEPNPFDPADPQGWALTPAERADAIRWILDFRAVVSFTLADLRAAGVPVDTGWTCDHANVAQVLLMLPKIPWEQTPRELADTMQPFGVSAVDRDGRGTEARDGRSDRASRNIERIRLLVRAEAGGSVLTMPYAGGGTRAVPKDVLVRREVVRQIFTEFTDASVPKIWQTYGNSSRTPGGFLRAGMIARLGTDPGRPSKSTLYSDIAAIESGNGADGEEVSD